MDKPMFERDLLYSTGNALEPGSIHIKVYKPDIEGKLPIVIQPKTVHSPIEFLDVIIGIMQSDVFDRINLDVNSNTILYIENQGSYTRIKPGENGFGNSETVKDLDF